MKKYLLIFLIFAGTIFAQNKPYLILISFDGFRWDYLDRGLTPNLNYLKENGVSALSLKPSFPSKTFPNHLSIITGMYPENHGVIANDFVDPFTLNKYSIRDTSAVRSDKWYLGEPFWATAKRQGIKTASYFWPGSEIPLEHKHPTYFEHYEHNRNYDIRIEGVINWLKLPYNERPNFITLYFDAADTYGHRYGPNSPEVNSAISKLDSLTGSLIAKLKEINLYDSTNVMIVSDHGMAEIDNQRSINIESITGKQPIIDGIGPVMMIKPEDGQIEIVYKKLKEKEDHFKVYKREEVPGNYHFSNNAFILPLILIAEPGWSLIDERAAKRQNNYTNKGNHGYDNSHLDMHGIFIASGPAFKQNYKTGTIKNVDIYPLLCKIFKIVPRKNIDGKLENIEFLLK